MPFASANDISAFASSKKNVVLDGCNASILNAFSATSMLNSRLRVTRYGASFLNGFMFTAAPIEKSRFSAETRRGKCWTCDAPKYGSAINASGHIRDIRIRIRIHFLHFGFWILDFGLF